MNNKTKLIKITGYSFSAIIIIFSMMYLAPNHPTLVLPFLLGGLVIVFPIETYLKKVEKQKKINRTFNWASYIIIITGFVLSLIYI